LVARSSSRVCLSKRRLGGSDVADADALDAAAASLLAVPCQRRGARTCAARSAERLNEAGAALPQTGSGSARSAGRIAAAIRK
jgi:hypothetical protein